MLPALTLLLGMLSPFAAAPASADVVLTLSASGSPREGGGPGHRDGDSGRGRRLPTGS